MKRLSTASAAMTAMAAIAVGWPGPASAASTWTTQTTALPAGATRGALQGVSCLTASRCTAVGFYVKHNATRSLAESWDGTAWTVQAAPSPAALNSSLNAVSCATSTSCMAVGYFQVAANDVVQPLAEHWNGSTWTIPPVSVPAGALGGGLLGVSCTSDTSCTATGYYVKPISNNRLVYALAERWDGSTWSIQATPSKPRSQLSGVSCTSDTSCTAVGNYEPTPPNGSQLTLAEHWNGTTWTVQPTPNPANPVASLAAIACSSAATCTAVGKSISAVGVMQTLAEHWNGSTWVTQPTPNPTATQAGSLTGLWGVSCPTASSCTAAATFAPTSFTARAAAEYWNGSSWKIQATAQPAAGKHLAAVSCVSAHVCTAVGGIFTQGTNRLLQQPLAEHD
ncbi:MAG TPA: hypothetical protein VGS62_07060 [Streptosporangiaceae bacterium]|nr:hypothetical protein [Streptosporangiaceae bacterium]